MLTKIVDGVTFADGVDVDVGAVATTADDEKLVWFVIIVPDKFVWLGMEPEPP